MRLDFNALWVDDQPDRIEAQIKRITARMEKEGFRFNPTVCSSLEKMRDKISQEVFTDEIDLILVDWDLGGEVRGQDAIAEIRGRAQYKDVVFYSAQAAPKDLRNYANSAELEGVFCASRESLVDDVIGVFEALVKKVLDLDHARGIVMGATSDIDHTVTECLILVHGKLDESRQQVLIAKMLERVSSRATEMEASARKLEQKGTLEALLEANMLFTAYDRLRILGYILKDEAFRAYSGSKTAINEYMERVVPNRNILGHEVQSCAGGARVIVDAKGNHIGLDEIRDLRCLILSLRQEFRGLLDSLRAAA